MKWLYFGHNHNVRFVVAPDASGGSMTQTVAEVPMGNPKSLEIAQLIARAPALQDALLAIVNASRCRTLAPSASWHVELSAEQVDAAYDALGLPKPQEVPLYDPNCPACLRHQPHSLDEHFAALQRNDEASGPEYKPEVEG